MDIRTTGDGKYEANKKGEVVGKVYEQEGLDRTEFRRVYEGWADVRQTKSGLIAVSANPDDLLPYCKGDKLL